MSYRIGIDVGGTFTDFLLVGDDVPLVHKTSSTPDDPSRGLVTGLAELAARLDLTLEGLVAQLDLIVHGTTVTTNAVLTREGARAGLLTTKGFRDTLALRDGTREDPYDNRLAPPEPLVPRHLRLPVGGRIDYKGDELAALETDDVRAAVETFAAEGVEAVAISFMHSPAEPGHERRDARPRRRVDARCPRDGVERPAAAGALLRPNLDDRAQRLRRADHQRATWVRSRTASRSSRSAAPC